MNKLETIKSRVSERLETLGLSRNEASRRAGLGLSYVNDLLAGKSKNPTRESLTKLGAVLQCDTNYIFGDQAEPVIERISGNPGGGGGLLFEGANTVTVYNVGLPDADGFFTLDDSKRSSVSIPFVMPAGGGANGYIVIVPDDTMAPRYRAGELVVVNPNKPVSRGGFALVRATDGRAMIREILAIAPDRISVGTLDGSAPVDIPRDQITALERIIAGTEM